MTINLTQVQGAWRAQDRQAIAQPLMWLCCYSIKKYEEKEANQTIFQKNDFLRNQMKCDHLVIVVMAIKQKYTYMPHIHNFISGGI